MPRAQCNVLHSPHVKPASSLRVGGHEAREFLGPGLDDLDQRGTASWNARRMDYHSADGPEFDQGGVNGKLHRADDGSGQARRAGL